MKMRGISYEMKYKKKWWRKKKQISLFDFSYQISEERVVISKLMGEKN